MKILMLGQNDPAGMMIAFAQAINRYTEHTARVISYRTMYAHGYDCDLELPCLGDDWGEVEFLLKDSDIFHFHMLLDESFQLGPFALKDFVSGKGVLYHHHGTYDHQCFLGRQEWYREEYARTGKRVVVSTPDLLEYLPTATWQPNIVPLSDPLFLPRAEESKSRERFHVVQAPTRKWHKNTDEFVRVCEELRKRSNFSYEVLSDISHRECLSKKRGANASFDHMQGWFGIASLESLAQGVPTLAGMNEAVQSAVRAFAGEEELPWRMVYSEEDLKRELLFLMEDRAQASEIGRASRAFMERRWSEQRVLEPLLATYHELR
ncbi:glycosyltransferase family 1 protein [bacterium]|nr:glycosyltransferase family 1 protein [bacterium]